MADQLQLRGGTTAEHATFTGALREVTVDTDKDTVVVHDNATAGGHPLAKENLSNVSAATAATKLDGQTVKFGLGAAATPSVTFNGDLNTGVYSPGADQVAISTNGTGRLFIDSSGRVGVGTSSFTAGHVFAVTGGYSSLNGLRISGSDINNTIYQTNGIGITTADYLTFATGGSLAERLRITAAGLVGIGTSSPDGTTHVHTASAGTVTANSTADDLVVENSGAGGISILTPDASNGALFFGSPSDAIGAAARWNYNLGEFYIGSDKAGGVTKLTSGDGTTAVTIDSSQRVGIGSSSPATQFSVQNASTSFGIETDTTSGFASGPTIRGYYRAGSAYTPLGLTGSAVAFGINDVEKMRLTSTGLGIGSTPVNKLDVSGSISASGSFSNTGYAPAVHIGLSSGNPTICSGNNVASTYLPLVFTRDTTTGSAESMRLDASGRLLVGTSTAAYSGASANLQLVHADGPDVIIARNQQTLAAGQTLGRIMFYGNDSDGTYERCAVIEAAADLDHGTGDKPSRLVFSTTADGASSPTERMRINSGGVVQINTASSGEAAFYLNVKATNAAAFGDSYDSFVYGSVQITRPANQNDDKHHLSFIRAGVQVAGIGYLRNSSTFAVMNAGGTNGSGVTLTASATSWGTTSDERKKKIAGNIENGLDKITDWRCVYFSYLNESDEVRRVGLIAQDVQATLPEAVSVEEDELGTLQLRYTEILPVLVKALQESKERIEALEAEVAALKAR